MSDVNSRKVKFFLNGNDLTLDKFIENLYSVPLDLIKGDSTLSEAIVNGIDFLKSRGYGEIIVAPSSTEDEVRIKCYRNSHTYANEIKFECRQYCCPTDDSTRPYTGDEWEEGDIVFSNGSLDESTFGWVCKRINDVLVWKQIGQEIPDDIKTRLDTIQNAINTLMAGA